MKKYVLPAGAIAIIAVFIGVSLFNVTYRVKHNIGVLIADEVIQLQGIFHRIHKTCIIIDFDYQKNRINFLNVGEFTGSEVGPMNLVYPDKWEGPYLEDNPTMQTIEYQIVHTKKGYFITPGDRVKLPNGKVVGKDIVLDEQANIPAMMINPDMLLFKGRALAAPLDLGSALNIQFQLGEEI